MADSWDCSSISVFVGRTNPCVLGTSRILLCSLHAATRDSSSQRGVHCWCKASQVWAFGLRSLLDPNCMIHSEGPFLSLVRNCLSATLNCFFVGGHPIFFRIDRTENVSLWPSFKTQFNSFASSSFMAIIVVVTGFACVLEHTNIYPHLHPLLHWWCEHSGGCQQSHADSFWHCSCWKG